MGRILICGTLAYDSIGSFSGRLADARRNIKLDSLTQAFGGCAMNIAYNLRQLGHEPVPFVYAGNDFAPTYRDHLERLDINQEAIIETARGPCARGIVLTDAHGAQFTAFYPGPTGLARHAGDIQQLEQTAWDAVIIAPDLPEKMQRCAAAFPGVPLRIWCPGQYAEMLEADDLEAMLGPLDLLIANRLEWEALCAHVHAGEIAQRVPELVITDGPGPVTLLHEDLQIPVPAADVVDPTGCGDAFAAALVGAKLQGASLADATTAGIHQAERCLAHRGSQRH